MGRAALLPALLQLLADLVQLFLVGAAVFQAFLHQVLVVVQGVLGLAFPLHHGGIAAECHHQHHYPQQGHHIAQALLFIVEDKEEHIRPCDDEDGVEGKLGAGDEHQPKAEHQGQQENQVLAGFPGEEDGQGHYQHDNSALGVGHTKPAHHPQAQAGIGVHRVPRGPGQRGEQHNLRQVDGKAGVNPLADVLPLLKKGDKGKGVHGEAHNPQEVGCVRHHGLVPNAVAVCHVGHPEGAHYPVENHIHPLFIADHKAQQGHGHQQQEAQRRGEGVVPQLPQKVGEHVQRGLYDDDSPYNPVELPIDGLF